MAFMLFLGTFLTSCLKKEELLQSNQKQNEAQFRRDPKACLTPIKLFCDSILWFENQEHFDAVYQCLEDAYEAHNEWFEQQTANMNDEEADEYAISINFDVDKPLIVFENFHQFYSYRKWLSDNDLQWVNNSLNPLDYDYTLDDIENTLLSRSGMYRIGSITHFYWNDIEYEIHSQDCEVIKNLIRDSEYFLPIYILSGIVKTISLNKKIHNVSCNTFLEDNMKETGTHYYTHNRFFVWKIKFKKKSTNFCNANYCYKIKSKMINYKVITGSVVRQAFKKMQTKNYAELYEYSPFAVSQNCNWVDSIGITGNVRRRTSIKAKRNQGFNQERYIISNSARANFAVVHDGNVYDITKYIQF